MSSRRSFLKNIGVGSLSGGLAACLSSCTSVHRHPNILFIMSDDHCMQAMSCYGGQFNQTPHLDRLAREGMRFNRCSVTNSLCAPSRATILTGKYSHQNSVKRNRDRFVGSQQTFPKLMQQAGYATALIGKWHLTSEPTGFDYWNILPGQGQYFDPEFIDMGQQTVRKGYTSDIITDDSMRWLRERGDEQPFMLMCHHKAPHVKHHYPEQYASMYEDKSWPLPETFHDDYSTRSSALADSCRWSKFEYIATPDLSGQVPPMLMGDPKFKEWACRTFVREYLRVVAAMDDSIGRLLDYLDESGLADNTIVVYTSDNGFFLGEHGFYNKQWMYEESLHIPLLVRYPGVIQPGSVSERMVSNLDFAETFLDYAGISIPDDMQGKSIRKILEEGDDPDWRKAVYYRYYGQAEVQAHYGIRTERYKLIHFYQIDEWELFDLKSDPHELKNLYNDSATAPVREELMQKLSELQRQYGDAIPEA
jgi:arylsulfatase A-like enzyme